MLNDGTPAPAAGLGDKNGELFGGMPVVPKDGTLPVISHIIKILNKSRTTQTLLSFFLFK